MDIKINIATDNDIEEISYLGRAFLENSSGGNIVSYNQKSFLDSLMKLRDLELLKVWIAKDNENIAGAVGLIISPNIYNQKEILGDIYFIDVLPEYQKQGIAKRFIKIIEKWALENNVIAISVSFDDKEITDKLCKSMDYVLFEYRIMKKMGD